MYIIKTYYESSDCNDIYDNLCSNNKFTLINAIEKELSENVLFKKIKITDHKDGDGWLQINNETEKWLRIIKLKELL